VFADIGYARSMCYSSYKFDRIMRHLYEELTFLGVGVFYAGVLLIVITKLLPIYRLPSNISIYTIHSVARIFTHDEMGLGCGIGECGVKNAKP